MSFAQQARTNETRMKRDERKGAGRGKGRERAETHRKEARGRVAHEGSLDDVRVLRAKLCA